PLPDPGSPPDPRFHRLDGLPSPPPGSKRFKRSPASTNPWHRQAPAFTRPGRPYRPWKERLSDGDPAVPAGPLVLRAPRPGRPRLAGPARRARRGGGRVQRTDDRRVPHARHRVAARDGRPGEAVPGGD